MPRASGPGCATREGAAWVGLRPHRVTRGSAGRQRAAITDSGHPRTPRSPSAAVPDPARAGSDACARSGPGGERHRRWTCAAPHPNRARTGAREPCSPPCGLGRGEGTEMVSRSQRAGSRRAAIAMAGEPQDVFGAGTLTCPGPGKSRQHTSLPADAAGMGHAATRKTSAPPERRSLDNQGPHKG
jgi:hypothetical protein